MASSDMSTPPNPVGEQSGGDDLRAACGALAAPAEAEEDLKWPDGAEELARIARVREIVDPATLEDLPEDFCDDLTIARFLRGHENDPEKAADFFGQSIVYRKELLQDEMFQKLRRQSADLELPNLRLLPHADAMLRVNPLFVVGFSTDDLPVMVTSPRFLDFDALGRCLEEDFGTYQAFFRGMIEQRALILHNLSVKQRRMVKFLDIRDLNQISVTTFLSYASNFMGRLKEIIGVVQNFYPEMIHRVILFNSPTGMRTLFDLFSTFLNARMKSKVTILPVGMPFHEVAQLLEARAIRNWFNEVASRLCFSSFYIANGTQEYCAKWCEAGETCVWLCSVEQGRDVKLIRVFIPAQDAAAPAAAAAPTDAAAAPHGAAARAASGVRETDLEERTVMLAEPFEGTFTAARAGVLVLCLCNFDAWWNAKTVTLTVNGAVVGLPPPEIGEAAAAVAAA